MDGSRHIVPIALAIVPTEDEDNWTFFYQNLKKSLPDIDNERIVNMHDREKGLRNAQRNILPNTKESDFLAVMNQIRSLNPEVAAYLVMESTPPTQRSKKAGVAE